MEERRKILWLCSWYPGMAEPFNGDFVQRHARAAAIYHDIYVIHVYADPNRKINAPITSISTHGGLTEHIIEFPKGKNRLARAISHLRLIRAYKKAVKTFIREHGLPDLVHVHVPVWAGKIALWIKWCYGIPFMVTEHWGIYNDIEVHNFKSKTIWFKKATKRIFLGASAFLSVSRYIAEGVKRLVTPVDYQLFPNAVDTDLFFPVDKSGEVFRFIHVSTMVGLKNVESILRAFESLFLAGKQAELIMVGPATSNIIKFAGQLQVLEGSIRFTGQIPYRDVASEMQSANCLILFSTIENSPCVIGEALCCGIPVISSNVGGIPELLNETNGMLVSSLHAEDLSNAMKEMMEKFIDLDRGKIAQKAKTKFSYIQVGKIMDQIYREIQI